jgi:ribosome maturation protein Sdo1
MKNLTLKIPAAKKISVTSNKAKRLPPKRIDPVLEELYSIKAQINKEAKYSVKEILKRAYPNAAS